MKNLIPLMQREWLQHRFAWALLMGVPLVLAALLLGFGTIDLGESMTERPDADLALLLASMAITTTGAVVFLLVWVTSLFISAGLPRRDHADRSVEFWLSLPTGHAESFAAPLLVHLVLVPAAALLVGLVGGGAVSLLLVGRFVGLGEWLAMPWLHLVAGALALAGRVMAGLPLALLWMSPLLLLAMLANAWLRRWGLPVLTVALSLSSAVLKAVFGMPLLAETLDRLMRNVGLSLAGASGQGPDFGELNPSPQVLQEVASWAVRDLLAALQAAASPLLLGCLVVSAGLFWALVLWRQRGAGSTG